MSSATAPTALGRRRSEQRSSKVPVRIQLAIGPREGTLDEPRPSVEAEAVVPRRRIAESGEHGALEFGGEEAAERMARVELEVVRERRLRDRVEAAVRSH